MTGTELRTIREALGWEQQEFARLLGVRGNTAWRWEHQTCVPQYVALLATLLQAHSQNRRIAAQWLHKGAS